MIEIASQKRSIMTDKCDQNILFNHSRIDLIARQSFKKHLPQSRKGRRDHFLTCVTRFHFFQCAF